jgi:hypothetical protein
MWRTYSNLDPHGVLSVCISLLLKYLERVILAYLFSFHEKFPKGNK